MEIKKGSKFLEKHSDVQIKVMRFDEDRQKYLCDSWNGTHYITKERLLKDFVPVQYMVIIKWWNGYNCGCCRQESTYIEYYDTIEEALDECKEYGTERVDGDWLDGIYKVSSLMHKLD